MPEKPREYKKRIDEQRKKRRKNRDELIEYINEYELVDERYKTETKKEILANFDKNEKAEKNSELYVKIWEELLNIEQKYKELEELKELLESKKQEYKDLNDELKEQNVDWDDKTTLKLQMQKINSMVSKLEKVEWEIEVLEKQVQDREKEIKEIEEMYWRKESIDETWLEDEEEQEIKKQQDENQTTENPETLQEYKKTVMNKRQKIMNTKWKILELLEEWTWIDKTLKEKIRWKISEVFEKYNDEIEWSLRIKSAWYIEDREAILKLDTVKIKNSTKTK